MSEEHSYTDKNGLKWNRILTSPRVSIDTKIDAFSERDFVNKTAKKGISVGDLWETSAELGEKRAKKAGVDPVEEKRNRAYEKKHNGKLHPNDKSRTSRVETKDYIIE
jgi:hypothetical protein